MNDMPEEVLESKLNRLKDLSRELGLFLPSAEYKIMTMLGDEVLESRSGISRSWNRNAYNWVASQMQASTVDTGDFGPGILNMRSTTGVNKTGYRCTQIVYYSLETEDGYTSYIDNVLRGIVIGTSTAAESFEHIALSSIISSGITSGRMSYQESNNPDISYNPGSREYTVVWSRYFNNNSGGTIDVGEIGLYARLASTSASSAAYYMVSRDVISPVISVDDQIALYVEYSIKLVFPG